MPSDLIAWYRQVRELRLPDVANGYFIHSPMVVVAHAEGHGVRQVTGRHGGPVIVFGSDGGGTLYAARSGVGSPVFRLPPGSVIDGVYASDDPLFDVIAADLPGFLDLLRDAVAGYVHHGETGRL